jgi:hypothetical protein
MTAVCVGAVALADALLFPVPWEKLVDLMDGMVSDACEDVGEVGVGIDAVHPAGFDDGVHTGGALSAGIGATEEVVFALMDTCP